VVVPQEAAVEDSDAAGATLEVRSAGRLAAKGGKVLHQNHGVFQMPSNMVGNWSPHARREAFQVAGLVGKDFSLPVVRVARFLPPAFGPVPGWEQGGRFGELEDGAEGAGVRSDADTIDAVRAGAKDGIRDRLQPNVLNAGQGAEILDNPE
jgi:hypothetical protein